MNKDIHNMVTTPPPVAYDPVKSFKNIIPNKIHSIGLPLKRKTKPSPGPGSYLLAPVVGNEGRKFSLRAKPNDHSTAAANLVRAYLRHKTPDPWAYNVPCTINPTGCFPCSNYRSEKGIPFNPPRSSRFFSSLLPNSRTLSRQLPRAGIL